MDGVVGNQPVEQKAANYRAAAQKALAESVKATNPHIKTILLDIARQYDRLAHLAEQARERAE